jgi:hypothetical protein
MKTRRVAMQPTYELFIVAACPPNFFLDPLPQHRYDKEEDVSYLKMAASRSLFENQTADGP